MLISIKTEYGTEINNNPKKHGKIYIKIHQEGPQDQHLDKETNETRRQ